MCVFCEQTFLKDSELVTSYSQVWAWGWGSKGESLSVISTALDCFIAIAVHYTSPQRYKQLYKWLYVGRQEFR